MRELNVLTPGKIGWLDKPEPVLENPTDALVRPFIASRCDGDALPIHMHSATHKAMTAGVRLGAIDASVGDIVGQPIVDHHRAEQRGLRLDVAGQLNGFGRSRLGKCQSSHQTTASTPDRALREPAGR